MEQPLAGRSLWFLTEPAIALISARWSLAELSQQVVSWQHRHAILAAS
jgi:hypothetical protein